MDLMFSSVEELYARLRPALRSKLLELKKNQIKGLEEEDIFAYLAEVKWKEASDLGLYEMVDDILHVSNQSLINHTQKKKGLTPLRWDEEII